MRIGVIGAGAIGGALAARLDALGHDVFVTARGAHLESIRRCGLRLTGRWGEHTAHIVADERLRDVPELAIVATKAQDAEAAIIANRADIDGLPVLVIQNGLDGRATASRLLPAATVLGGIASYGANIAEPGHIDVTTTGPLLIGGEDTFAAGRVVDVLAEAAPTRRTADIEGAEWTKLLVNHVNALPAITGLSIQQTLADRQLARVVAVTMREAIDVADALGVRFQPVQGLDARNLRLLRRLPLPIATKLPMRIGRRMGPVPNVGSTLQSIQRGARTEIDYLNGAVVAHGEKAGVPTPVSRRVVELVHEIEGGRGFLSPGDASRYLLGG